MLNCYTKTIKRSSLSGDILYERIKQSDCRENSGTIRTALNHFGHSWPRPLEFDWINLWLLWIHNHMQKTNFIAQLIPLWNWHTMWNNCWYAQACQTTSTWNDCINLSLIWMPNYIQNFHFIFQLICEILYIKQSCILICLEIFGP